MTRKQKVILDILKRTPDRFVSPTSVGCEYGRIELGRSDCHSSTASPTLMKLVAIGLAERNKNGWYKYIQQ